MSLMRSLSNSRRHQVACFIAARRDHEGQTPRCSLACGIRDWFGAPQVSDLRAQDVLIEVLGKELSEVEREESRKRNLLRQWKKKVGELKQACRFLGRGTDINKSLETECANNENKQMELENDIQLLEKKSRVSKLQKECLAAAQRTKLLESENQLLLSEAEQLRQEVLEENLDNSLVREENALDNEGPPGDCNA
ncbi:hypothetical protein B0H11DRAFT_2368329 [Mycena galericulata]|nr:hypothetical protein B0H11DRAFT_2368329 [Mycena galericulata]